MNEQLYIAFENYLNNEMSQEEKLEFENKLLNDSDMQQKFEIYKETNQFLSVKFDSDAADFEKNLQTISKQNFSDTKSTRGKAEQGEAKSKVIAFKPWYYAVAASVAVLLGIWFSGSRTPEYSDFNQHEEAHFVERGTVDKNMIDAQKFYNAKDYQKAIVSFESIEDLTNPELQYFYAIALIETNHSRNAKVYLDNLRAGRSVYKDKATWYLALLNLKKMKFEECKTYLKKIPADAEDYDKAQKLLKNLD